MVIILFGVTGTGKTVVGKLLARDLRWAFLDADDFHSPANVEKMRQGIPLTDADRLPWLDNLRKRIVQVLESRENAVLACSALKRAYRQHLEAGNAVRFVYLKGDYALIAERLQARTAHFMNPDLLRSQFDALEEPEANEHVIVVDVERTPEEIVGKIRQQLSV